MLMNEVNLLYQFIFFLFQDSQKHVQDVSQNTTSSSLRKAKSATGLIDTKRISVQQSVFKKDGRENFTSKLNTKVAKMELTKAKTPLVQAKAPEQSSNNKERSTIVTSSGVESMDAENFPSFNPSGISPLSSNVEIEARIEEQREKKPKVRFEAEPDHIDLSETQNGKESASSCTELLKENLQPEVRSCCEFYMENEPEESLILNVIRSERVNQAFASIS